MLVRWGAGFLVTWMAAAAQEPQSCVKCHEKEHRAEAGSPHDRVATCTDCHGGNPRAPEKEASHGGFTGKIARAAVPALCARCHSEPRRMNPSGLPTDQHAQYLTSKHAEAVARGNLKAAVCTDCHGTHGLRRARDPQSPVHPSRVPATCGRCHSDPAVMAGTGHPADEEALYRKGIHGERLLGKGDTAAPNCASCHGNHGAVPPGSSDVGRTCGKCHVRQREFFEASPHAFYARDGAFKECTGCHANHAIVRGYPEISGRCAPCHEPGDKELVAWKSLRDLVESSRDRFQRTADRVGRFARAGLHTDEEQVSLEEARTSLLQLAPLQHTLDLKKVGAAAADVGSRLKDVEDRLDGRERGERLKKLALVPAWAFLLSLAALFWARKRLIERELP